MLLAPAKVVKNTKNAVGKIVKFYKKENKTNNSRFSLTKAF